MSPRKTKSCPPSVAFPALLQGVAYHKEEITPPPSQGTDVVRPQDGAYRAPYPKGIHMKLYHRGEALAGSLSTAGKETPSRGVKANRDGEQQVQKVHRSVWVNLKQRHPFSKPGTGSTQEARWANKECTPRPERFSVNNDPPSSLMTWNLVKSSLTRFSGVSQSQAPHPPTKAVGGRVSVGRRRCRLPQGLLMGG